MRPRILVAEDHPPLRDLLVRTLQGCGYQVGTTVSCTGLEFELVASSLRRDLIRLVVADTSLIDGAAVAAVLRAREQGWRGRVIFVAPFAGAQERAEVRAVRDAVLLDRPFDPQRLRAVAEALVPASGMAPVANGAV